MTSTDTKTPSMRRMTHTHTVTHTHQSIFRFHLFRCDFCPGAISICHRSTCCVSWTSHRHSEAMHFLFEIPSTIAHRKSIVSPYYYTPVFDVTTTFNAKTFRHVLARNASHTLSPPKHIRVCGWCREWMSAAKRQMTLCHSDSTTATWFIPLRWSKRTELRQAKVNRKVNEIEISRVLNTLFSAFNFICQFARNTWPYFPHTHTHTQRIDRKWIFVFWRHTNVITLPKCCHLPIIFYSEAKLFRQLFGRLSPNLGEMCRRHGNVSYSTFSLTFLFLLLWLCTTSLWVS